MATIELINDVMNIKITQDLPEKEEEELLAKRRTLRKKLEKRFKMFEFQCGCGFETIDIFKMINHENRCLGLNFNIEEIMAYLDKNSTYTDLIPSQLQCRFCFKRFRTKNLLHQHLTRGVRLGCIDRVLKVEIQNLGVDEKVELLHFIRKIKNE